MNLKIVFLAAVILLSILAWMFLSQRPTSNASLEMVANNNFTRDLMIPLQKDSFVHILKSQYGDQLEIVDGNPIEVRIKNSGSKISDFYNDNERILREKHFGFDIIKDENNQLVAKFEIEKIDQGEYILLPSDVVYGVFQN